MLWNRTAALALGLTALLAAGAAEAQPRRTRAQPADAIKIGVGHGIGFLPLYVAADLKLFDKHAAAGLRLSLQRFANAEQLRRALAKGEIAAGAFGLTAFLRARDGKRQAPEEMVAVSGITTLPLVLLTARREIKSLSDLKEGDRIAVPSATAPQVTFLRMQAERWFGGEGWNRLRTQLIAMPHREAVDALLAQGSVAAYFASPPFTQAALKNPKVRPLMTSVEAAGGKTSFLILASPRAVLAAQPQLAGVLSKAVDEAAAAIRKDPRAAASIWLKYEPSHTLDARAVEAILRELKDDFGSGIYGVEAMAAHLRRAGRLQEAPASWKDVVAPVLARGEGS